MSRTVNRGAFVARRGALVIVAAVALFVLTQLSTPARAWDFAPQEIADRAAGQGKGTYGGQCKVFAQKVVNEVLRSHGIKAQVTGYGTPGGAYFGAYERAGGVLIESRHALPGDLIQVITPELKNEDFPPTRDRKNESILHTAIIVKVLGEGRYVVRDSNYVAHETIGQHRWTPDSWRKRGVEVYVWRFGAVNDDPIEAAGSSREVSGDPWNGPVTLAAAEDNGPAALFQGLAIGPNPGAPLR